MTLKLFDPTKNENLFSNDNYLLLNSQLSETKKLSLYEAVKSFFEQHPDSFKAPFFLIPTSGTTSFSLKIVLLEKSAVLNSAQRVGSFFKFDSQENWLLTLPIYHVGGLSILARSHLFKQNVIKLTKWQMPEFLNILNKTEIHWMSLVPTQIYDLILSNISAPVTLKGVFVGGGLLTEALFVKAKNLGWPLIKTFGMTETSSMIAYSQSPENQFFPLPKCEVKVDLNTKLLIKCDSLFSGYLIEEKNEPEAMSFVFEKPKKINDFWQSEDLAQINSESFKILGRNSDMIKINGELVNLNNMRNLLLQLNSNLYSPIENLTLISKPHERTENELILIATNSPANLPTTENEKSILNLISLFNQKVLPFERIKHYLLIDSMPLTELGKIKYSEFKSTKFLEILNEKGKSCLV